MEGYFQDPRFDQNTVRDSGRRKISRETGFNCFPRNGIHQNLGSGSARDLFACLSGIREVVRSSGKCEKKVIEASI